MQNRYVGDFGDYCKYGLLRYLVAGDQFRLGVNWYLVPDESHNGDGSQTQYLLPEREAANVSCDPDLYRKLRVLVMSGERSVLQVRARRVFPLGTALYESPLLSESDLRMDWHQQALVATAGCDAVFLDPDNGVSANPKLGLKHASVDEIAAYAGRGQTVVVYQHLNRYLKNDVQSTIELIGSRISDCTITGVRTLGSSQRAFVVVSARDHEALINERLSTFLKGAWAQHFAAV